MDAAGVLLDVYGRIPPLARQAVAGLDADALIRTAVPGTNPIGWLVWHATRVQDDHVAEVLGADQVWVDGDWSSHVGLEPDPSNLGYGHTAEDVASVRPDGPDSLLAYLEAVDTRTRAFLAGLDDAALDRVVDEGWDPPVTLGVRLVSVADDSLQHLGQAAYLRGLLGI